ncbi:WxcM-like domain-containing protein [Paenibacillus sp.]|uniref:polysaccharide biosynthesis C-terminal domain-containing protein n=1 Tax=Paenibacillus sp. TaxID=58172 RepID=UPI002D2FA838|nr:WxcM-like domain-containing protein [Paenibacillus sp.]HZG87976.1 WxcM-like domain-containing protein [Paenibacillus sp.]
MADLGFEMIPIQPYEDQRGSLKKIIMKSLLQEVAEIQEVYLLYSEKDSVRGNHYHKRTLEYFTVVSGTAKITLMHLDTSTVKEIYVSSHDHLVIKVPPYVAHAFKNEADQPLIMLAVSSKEYDKQDTDTFPMEIMK